MFRVNHNQFEQSANKTVTIIYKMLKDYLSDHQVLPPNLIVNCDNCWRENKVYICSVSNFNYNVLYLEQVGTLLLCSTCPTGCFCGNPVSIPSGWPHRERGLYFFGI